MLRRAGNAIAVDRVGVLIATNHETAPGPQAAHRAIVVVDIAVAALALDALELPVALALLKLLLEQFEREKKEWIESAGKEADGSIYTLTGDYQSADGADQYSFSGPTTLRADKLIESLGKQQAVEEDAGN